MTILNFGWNKKLFYPNQNVIRKGNFATTIIKKPFSHLRNHIVWLSSESVAWEDNQQDPSFEVEAVLGTIF